MLIKKYLAEYHILLLKEFHTPNPHFLLNEWMIVKPTDLLV